MKTQIIHMSDDYDSLKAGHDYKLTVPGRTHIGNHDRRQARFTDEQTGETFTLWAWQVEHAMLRGMMHKVTEPVSDAMHAPVVEKLCHSTSSNYIY